MAFYSISDSVTLNTYIRYLMNILMFFFYEKRFPPMYKSSTMCQNVYRTYAKMSGKTKGCATCSRSKLVPGRCAHTQNKCIRALLQVCLHEAEVTRTSQKHAVRCDMYTPEELHAGRLWVTKYGWGNEGTEVRRRTTPWNP